MGLGSYSPKQRMAAIAAAEPRLDREGHKAAIRLRPNQIKTKPELFQPRTITYGLRATEDSHVQALIQGIRAGDTPPQPVVIKLRDEGYVVVDGHHTVAAYKGADQGDKKITCEWFPGTVQEAFNLSMARNSEDKLSIPNVDKQERAWTLVVMNQPKTTKHVKEIRHNTKISLRQVWNMKRVWEAAQARDNKGKAFRHRLRLWHHASGGNPYLPDLEGEIEGALECLAGLTWTMARGCYEGKSIEEATEQEQAASLARLLDSRMQDRLKRSARITAIALNLHDPGLMGKLVEEWAKLQDELQLLTDAREEYKRPGDELKRKLTGERNSPGGLVMAAQDHREACGPAKHITGHNDHNAGRAGSAGCLARTTRGGAGWVSLGSLWKRPQDRRCEGVTSLWKRAAGGVKRSLGASAEAVHRAA